MFVLKRDQYFIMNWQVVITLVVKVMLGEIDVISTSNPKMIVHECRYKVDGITKYIENTEFDFDNAFSHEESNEELYKYSI